MARRASTSDTSRSRPGDRTLSNAPSDPRVKPEDGDIGRPSPLSIWAVSDGRAGIENQVLGLAEAIQRLTPAEVSTRRLRFQPPFDRWPNALRLWPAAMLAADSDRIEPPFPDLLIAAGRASLPFSTRMRRWSGGRTFVVQLQNPRAPLSTFDLVIPPLHDGLTGPNVLPILGSPNRITSETLDDAARAFADRIAALPRPCVAVLIGGASRAYGLTPEAAARMADAIAETVRAAGGSLLATFSRRTPDAVRAVMRRRLGEVPGWTWDGTGQNPYFAFLGSADHILVTRDSVNMAAEAGVTGKPVHVLTMDGGSPKFDAFHAELARRGVTRPFDGGLSGWTYAPLDETRRAARAVLDRLRARGG